MAAPRKQKIGLERSATRARLLEAAEQLMLEEGYMAVTSRRVGNTAGVRPQLVHYYFPSMDDLFVALFRQRSEQGLQAAAEALQGENPLRVIWEQSKDLEGASLSLEFMTLANHRKVISSEIAKVGELHRQLQYAALTKYFELRKIKPQVSPKIISLILSSIGMLIVLESQVGITYAHQEAEALVESILSRFEINETVDL